jgi:hypothetical protein
MRVVMLKSDSESFRWNDGLFIVVAERNGEYDLCKLRDGTPALKDDGSYMITRTSVRNPGIKETKLIYEE